MSTGLFPARLKYSEIIPIHKKGDKTDMSNYRPISLLPIFSKVFEKIIYKRMISHLNAHNLLAQEQFGFRKNSSTTLAAYNLMENIYRALNNKYIVGGIFCDLSKAFDRVNHDILLSKMDFYGIEGVAQKLIRSYLRGRYQRVILYENGSKCCSEWKEIQCGVPQGSVLGPVLFLLYVNDLPKIISDLSKPVLFADDTSILIFDKNPATFKIRINNLFEMINEWFRKNELVINYEKTYFLQFKTKNSKNLNVQVSYLNNLIPSISNISFLGLKIENSLTWESHIDAVIDKLNRSCFAIRSVKSFLPLETLKMMYFSYVHSIITYGLIFWGNSPHSIKVFRMQKRIIRIITNTTKRTSCRNLFQKLDILPLQAQYILSIALFVIVNKELFTFNSQMYNCSTRSTCDLHYPQTSLTQFQKGICYMGVKIFNHLPPKIKSMSNDLKNFKIQLTSFLLKSSFYTCDEFFSSRYA